MAPPANIILTSSLFCIDLSNLCKYIKKHVSLPNYLLKHAPLQILMYGFAYEEIGIEVL